MTTTHRNCLTDEQEERLVRLARGGSTYAELAIQFGCHYNTVRNIVKRHGGAKKDGRVRDLTAEQHGTFLDAYDAGMALERAAQLIGISRSMGLRLLVDAGRSYQPRRNGTNNPSWKGGRIKDRFGYMLVWVKDDDPMIVMAARHNRPYVREHRLVMARFIGRPLAKWETVHHINGQRDDNRIENLQLRQGHHGPGAAFICGDCGSSNVRSEPIRGGGHNR